MKHINNVRIDRGRNLTKLYQGVLPENLILFNPRGSLSKYSLSYINSPRIVLALDFIGTMKFLVFPLLILLLIVKLVNLS